MPICDNISLPLSHRDAVISTFVFVHQTLHQANARVARRGGRTMAITPRHYLDFINHYVILFSIFCVLCVILCVVCVIIFIYDCYKFSFMINYRDEDQCLLSFFVMLFIECLLQIIFYILKHNSIMSATHILVVVVSLYLLLLRLLLLQQRFRSLLQDSLLD